MKINEILSYVELEEFSVPCLNNRGNLCRPCDLGPRLEVPRFHRFFYFQCVLSAIHILYYICYMFGQFTVTPTVHWRKCMNVFCLLLIVLKVSLTLLELKLTELRKKIYFENPSVAFVRNLLPTIFQTKVLSPSPFLGYWKLTNPNMRSNTGSFNVQL